MTHGKRFFNQNGLQFDLFGMPSGHAQSAFFSTIYIYLALKDVNITLIYFALSILICVQRVYSNYHSVSQVLIGSIVGILLAYFVFFIFKSKIKGIIREKKDDEGPI
jgi:membrane-associated phospholipid phosphatase